MKKYGKLQLDSQKLTFFFLETKKVRLSSPFPDSDFFVAKYTKTKPGVP